MQIISGPPLFHQVENPVFVPPGFSAELVGSYDTSDVFAPIFLQTHNIPSLPTDQAFAQIDQVPHDEQLPQPKSPSGAAYTLSPGTSPQELDDDRDRVLPSYSYLFDSDNPEISSMLQVAEMQIILGLAKNEMKQAYIHAAKTARRVQATVDKQTRQMSRWQHTGSIPVKADVVGQSFVQVQPSGETSHDGKGPGPSKVYGGDLLSFD